jgi:putative membrane protein
MGRARPAKRLLLLALSALWGVGLAHDGTLITPATLSSAWNWDPLILFSLIAASLLYARGLWVLWRRAGVGRGVGRWQAAAFAGGIYTLFVALVSPLDALGHALFSAHMAQHMLLALVAAPLLVLGAPLLPLLWVLPGRGRRAAGSWWNDSRRARALWHGLTGPLVVCCLFAVILWVWHLPGLYQAAVESALVHALEHASMLFAAGLFWWLVVQPLGRRRLNYGGAILLVFITSVHSTVLGALFVFAPTPLYPLYEASVGAWGLTPIADQRLAGLIMRTPGTFIFLLTIAVLFLLWLSEMERRASPPRSVRAAPVKPDVLES